MTCKDCIHYEACKYLIDFVDGLTEKLNDKLELKGDERLPRFGFPMDDKNGLICNNQAHRDEYKKLSAKAIKRKKRSRERHLQKGLRNDGAQL